MPAEPSIKRAAFFIDGQNLFHAADNPFWHTFWTGKLAVMGRQGVSVFSRPLRYRNTTIRLPDGTVHTFLIAEEKGVDVRIAIDVIRRRIARSTTLR